MTVTNEISQQARLEAIQELVTQLQDALTQALLPLTIKHDDIKKDGVWGKITFLIYEEKMGGGFFGFGASKKLLPTDVAGTLFYNFVPYDITKGDLPQVNYKFGVHNVDKTADIIIPILEKFKKKYPKYFPGGINYSERYDHSQAA